MSKIGLYIYQDTNQEIILLGKEHIFKQEGYRGGEALDAIVIRSNRDDIHVGDHSNAWYRGTFKKLKDSVTLKNLENLKKYKDGWLERMDRIQILLTGYYNFFYGWSLLNHK